MVDCPLKRTGEVQRVEKHVTDRLQITVQATGQGIEFCETTEGWDRTGREKMIEESKKE